MTSVKGLITLLTTVLSFTVMAQCSTITTPEYPLNQWIVRVYNTKYITGISNSTYYGYYTQKLDATNNYGVKTSLQWASNSTSKPSQAIAFSNEFGTGTAYSGCALTNQDFSFVHKRQGFPAGQYEIFVDRWDDKTEVYLNGTLVVEMADYGNNTHAPKCIYLDANSKLEVRTDNRGGSMSELNMRIVRTNVNLNFTPSTVEICRSQSAALQVSASQSSVITNNTTNITSELTNISWTGASITSGQSTNSINVSPLTTTTYTYNARYKNCPLTGTVVVNVEQPPGDPSVYGNNTWNIYGYDKGTNTDNSAINSLNYYGYYTQNIDAQNDYGFNTAPAAVAGWALNTTPSYSSTWQGCDLPNNNSFTYIHKRKGFPCGSYNITMEKWDSNTRLFINGTQISSLSGTCITNTCSSQFIGTYELDANSTIEVRTNEDSGDSWTKLKIEPITSNNLAINNDEKTCPVKGNQWVNFYSHPDGRYLASVRGTSAESDLGNVTVRTYVDAQNQMSLACNNIDHITAVMQRHWLIDALKNGSAEVRLPYKDQEFIKLDSASVLSINPDDRVTYPNQTTVKLTKYDGPNENGNVNDNCSGNSVLYYANNSVFNPLTYHYQDFVIPGFSEFWLHGTDYETALPLVLNNFTVECTDKGQNIEVQALIENNTDFIRVDYSENGNDWKVIIKEKATPQPLIYQSFKGYHNASREGYYRVSTIDKNGKVDHLKVLHQKCDISSNSFRIYPNPATDDAVLQFNFPQSTATNIDVQIVSITGQIVDQMQIPVSGSTFNLSLQLATYPKGTYLVYVSDGENNRWVPQQLIIQ